LLSEQRPNISSGEITKQLSKKTACQKVIDFIISCLNEFREKFKGKNPENGLTQELVYILDNKDHSIELIRIGISREHMEDTSKGNSPQDDIAIRAKDGVILDAKSYQNNQPFMVIEAKRLDSRLDKKREKEYVVGRIEKNNGQSKYIDSGGIERFKKEIHGKNVDCIGMIGYLQTEDFDNWLEKINSWIEEEINNPSSNCLVWLEDDKLIHKKGETIFKMLGSKHKCLSGKEKNMYHIWVDLVT
jgi:hypothetical protein